MNIHLIEHNSIDKRKYDSCIEKSNYCRIYALSWYLDTVAPRWKLLATEDYSYVMPLPIKRKWGIPYLLTPYLSQQLGLFSVEEITIDILQQFLERIKVPYCILSLNPGNIFPVEGLQESLNYILPLKYDYPKLKEHYNSNTLNDLKKIAGYNLFYDKGVDVESFFNAIKKDSVHYSDELFPWVEKVTQKSLSKDSALLRAVRKTPDSEIIAVALFLFFKDRFYYMANVSSKEGRSFRAMRFLVDQFIQENADTGRVLDFEGSSIASVAQFYKGFGAALEAYPKYTKKSFPFFSQIRF